MIKQKEPSQIGYALFKVFVNIAGASRQGYRIKRRALAMADVLRMVLPNGTAVKKFDGLPTLAPSSGVPVDETSPVEVTPRTVIRI